MTETFHAGPGLGRLSDVTIIHGNCLEAMAELAADSVDAIVTDPPYGLGFMGKAWDDLPPGIDWAKQCLRVLKPGGHLLAFGGTRTWHRLAVAVEDAGFEIRDSIAWLYGSGFPKSLDVSKAIDKAAGATREVVGQRDRYLDGGKRNNLGNVNNWGDTTTFGTNGVADVTAPATPEAEQWSGWGSAIKPAFEPVVVARKPFKGTLAANVLAHGTGALNIDGCRIEGGSRPLVVSDRRNGNEVYGDGLQGSKAIEGGTTAGRWPANVVLDADQAAALDEQSGTRAAGNRPKVRNADENRTAYGDFAGQAELVGERLDSGGASRFFLNVEADEQPLPEPPKGRWPANVVLDEDQAAALDEQSGTLKSGGSGKDANRTALNGNGVTMGRMVNRTQSDLPPSEGGASRFFHVAQCDLRDCLVCVNAPCCGEDFDGEDFVLCDCPEHGQPIDPTPTRFRYCAKAPKKERPVVIDADGKTHSHSTVKPLTLMRWLVRLVTPPGGIVLDPFAGSGTTVEAALLEDFRVIGIERGGPEGTNEYHYLGMIQQRIARCL